MWCLKTISQWKRRAQSYKRRPTDMSFQQTKSQNFTLLVMSQCVAYLYQVTTARTTTFLDISNSFPDPRLCLLCILFSLTRFILPPTNLNVTQISVQPLDIPIFIVFPFFSIENVLVHQSIAWVNVNESGRSSIQFLKTIARLSGTILGLVQTNNFSRGGLKQKPEIKYTMTSPHSHAMSRV